MKKVGSMVAIARSFIAGILLLLCLSISGCVEDNAVLTQIHEYFPGSTLFKFDRRVLWIQTQVDGVSGKFAEKTIDSFLQDADGAAEKKSFGLVHFSDALAHDGIVYLVIGFRRGIIVWDRRRVTGPNGLPTTYHWVLNWEQAPAWFTQHIGYYPQKEQITIVSQ
jgi:hypothetical protein